MTEQLDQQDQPREPGVVYILENEALPPKVIKVGKTGQRDWVVRIRQLNTAVHLPFTCYKASRVDDMSKVETFLHNTFHPAKRHWRGEFHEVEPWRVAQVLKLFEVEDVTELAPVPDVLEEQAINTAVAKRESRADFTFELADIPPSAKLRFRGRPAVEAEVFDGKTTVSYQGETYSMSILATKIKEKDYVVQGVLWWTSQCETLKQTRVSGTEWKQKPHRNTTKARLHLTPSRPTSPSTTSRQ